MITSLIVLATLQTPILINGDDYNRPDIKAHRIERNEDRRSQERKFRWEQQNHYDWLDSISKPRY